MILVHLQDFTPLSSAAAENGRALSRSGRAVPSTWWFKTVGLADLARGIAAPGTGGSNPPEEVLSFWKTLTPEERFRYSLAATRDRPYVPVR